MYGHESTFRPRYSVGGLMLVCKKPSKRKASNVLLVSPEYRCRNWQEREADEQMRCRVCGCTWNNGCPGGCYWVEPDLCSQCIDKVGVL